jgi:hypothetical protein
MIMVMPILLNIGITTVEPLRNLVLDNIITADSMSAHKAMSSGESMTRTDLLLQQRLSCLVQFGPLILGTGRLLQSRSKTKVTTSLLLSNGKATTSQIWLMKPFSAKAQ